ncbi:hypothetical protein MBH78_17045 [Oceanimonas sp. NS1]|nr:hypothetical protein [Oceanimonas sp. NS1]
MLSCVRHPLIPEYLAYALRGRQGILLMSRAPGKIWSTTACAGAAFRPVK